ncbi:MAG: transposase [Xenococcaceae cyanobacterium MO_234.B1]|nr:transposase [Xenococcaceae cyanobacterium MO_234.B1]
MLTRRITFRLYPSKAQEQKMFWARRMHAYLYNAAVANRKTQYQRLGHSVDYFEQQASLPGFKETWVEYKELNAGSLQATLKRVDFAFVRFFQGLGKYPKFKPIKTYSGWTYPDGRQGFKAHTSGKNGYLELRDLGFKIQMRGQARTWGKPTTCTIVYRKDKWFASITIRCLPTRETGKGSIGLDFGCKTAVAMSDGTMIEPPKFLAQASDKIKQASKQLRRKRKPESRKQKASRRWKKARAKISQLQKKVANQRQNWVHHVAVDIVRNNSLIATEKLQVKNMTRKAKKGSKRKRQKTGLNRSMLDVGMGMLRSAIAYKVKEAGGIFLEAPTRSLKPTQRCVKCWKLTKKTLSDRLHICSNPSCQHTEDRDINSAQVCLAWARGQELSSKTADGSSSTENPKVKYCEGFQQLAQTKRQKLEGLSGEPASPACKPRAAQRSSS